MPQRFLYCAMGIRSKTGVLFQLAQCNHGTNGKAALGLLYGVQFQTGQVDTLVFLVIEDVGLFQFDRVFHFGFPFFSKNQPPRTIPGWLFIRS